MKSTNEVVVFCKNRCTAAAYARNNECYYGQLPDGRWLAGGLQPIMRKTNQAFTPCEKLLNIRRLEMDGLNG